MGKATAIVHTELLNKLLDRCIRVKDVDWDKDLHYIVIDHPDAPDRRHVDVILDEKGLRFKPDVDV